ncbi:MAG: hypothetical protein COY81_00250 [Candidatus Pacebacteria bacterium CG_4_10_14_0_8_um_filter_43_12]|nr:MAG: hypothetical protein COY81_00250 [Candidatus Pacebacteria bacterium CG_4_10_14_0_8_um_filter_43_12]
MKIIIRRAIASDSQQLFLISNDPLVRSSSLNTKVIGWSEHQAWYQRQLSDKNSLFFVAEVEKTVVGQLRFTFNQSEALVSISIDPKRRHMKIGSTLLQKSLLALSANYPKIFRLKAIVKATNAASVGFFKNYGFKQHAYDSVKQIYTYLYTIREDPS